jgi:hypothetical protein
LEAIVERPRLSSEIPLDYLPRLRPMMLSPDQVDEIVGHAREREPDSQIWFIQIGRNYRDETRSDYDVNVYFAPEETSPRIHTGRYMWLSSFIKQIELDLNYVLEQAADSDTSDADPPPRDKGLLRTYVHVSETGRTFTNTLDVPSLPILPFEKPSGFTDEEVVEIVDFVRSGSRIVHELNDTPILFAVDTTFPVHAIKRDGDVVEVTTGIQEGLLAGRGEGFQCKKIDRRWVLVGEFWEWVS